MNVNDRFAIAERQGEGWGVLGGGDQTRCLGLRPRHRRGGYTGLIVRWVVRDGVFIYVLLP